jgi:hypothetical protein
MTAQEQAYQAGFQQKCAERGVDPVALIKWAQAVAPDPDTTLDGKRPLNPRLPDNVMFRNPPVKGTNVLGRTVAPTATKKAPQLAPKLPVRK